jgi:hypothetical protein
MEERLLMEGDRTLNEALNQAIKLEAAKVSAGPPISMGEVRGAHAWVGQAPDRRREGRPCAGSSVPMVTCAEIPGGGRVMTRTRKASKFLQAEGLTVIATLKTSIYAQRARSCEP